jgi:hypothetical protein
LLGHSPLNLPGEHLSLPGCAYLRIKQGCQTGNDWYSVTPTDRSSREEAAAVVPFEGIVSADDHVVEPANLWSSRLPARFVDAGPRVVRERFLAEEADFGWSNAENGSSPEDQPTSAPTAADGEWADVWYYEGHVSR